MSPEIKISSNMQNEGAIKVAFATNDKKNIDAHFGSAKAFHVYTVSNKGYEIVSIIDIQSKDTDKTVSLLKGIDIVYFVNIGPTAAAKIINSGIFPIKYKEIVSIDTELDKLQSMLGENPPPFIKKIISQKVA
ncbi:MAG TPA: dinitrogenase iron-molybdenum cofactor biosynthesis protein [Campylobacterales bacterium]|nr:dinitrogenase iron-molybdenum cofactor biosynthesis protein [Campylobacterales bacterium]HHC11070.1 dinitrogenase iron-molybdenum cofactor biosynthesis protein [Campylobacterales bacterium]HHD80620.1 dinitrogenase iron-molybdenum cofactor biosynthesis protein [Campylobacterales bacterium]